MRVPPIDLAARRLVVGKYHRHLPTLVLLDPYARPFANAQPPGKQSSCDRRQTSESMVSLHGHRRLYGRELATPGPGLRKLTGKTTQGPLLPDLGSFGNQSDHVYA